PEPAEADEHDRDHPDREGDPPPGAGQQRPGQHEQHDDERGDPRAVPAGVAQRAQPGAAVGELGPDPVEQVLEQGGQRGDGDQDDGQQVVLPVRGVVAHVEHVAGRGVQPQLRPEAGDHPGTQHPEYDQADSDDGDDAAGDAPPDAVRRPVQAFAHRPTLPDAAVRDTLTGVSSRVSHRPPTAGTLRRLERTSGSLATQAVARMDEQLPWFRAMPADQRSWVMLVAQAGIASLVEWCRNPNHPPRLTGEVFGAAPRELVRAVPLRQTVDLIRVTLDVLEDHVESVAEPGDAEALRMAVLQFSREVAFATAHVHASFAENRGAWDA